MIESGYYPAGAEYDRNAPWNQSDPESREFDIEVIDSILLSATITTDNYIEEIDEDEDGRSSVCTFEGSAEVEFRSQFMSLQDALKVVIPILEDSKLKKVKDALMTLKIYSKGQSEIESA